MSTNLIVPVDLREELKVFRARHGIRTWNQLALRVGQPVTTMRAIRHLRPTDATIEQSIRAAMARFPDPAVDKRPAAKTAFGRSAA